MTAKITKDENGYRPVNYVNFPCDWCGAPVETHEFSKNHTTRAFCSRDCEELWGVVRACRLAARGLREEPLP